MNDRIKDLMSQFEKKQAETKIYVQSLIDKGDFLDDDGYPTDDALEIISKWGFDDDIGWFEFIKSLWAYKNWGWHDSIEPHPYRKDKTVRQYDISTAGWSGNESIIRAMESNDMKWHNTWVQSRRGGHYIFEVNLDE